LESGRPSGSAERGNLAGAADNGRSRMPDAHRDREHSLMADQRRFTGRQLTIMVVAIAVAAIAAPAGVLAATATSVRLVDGSNPHHAATVSKHGAVSVAVAGTPMTTTVLPASAFSISTNTADKLLIKAPCGTKFAISSLTLDNAGAPAGAGINLVTIGAHGIASTGDELALQLGANQQQQLTFPQPFLLRPAALAKGNACKSEQLFEDGGAATSTFIVVGYRTH
jgi:hypothetical protein